MDKCIKATGCAFNTSQLFINFPYKKLEITCNECEKINGNRHRDALVNQIFREHYKMVINDVIDNNVTFQLPVNGRRCEIHMQTFKDEQFKNFRRKGKWKSVDFLKSWFTGHMLGLFMHSPKRPPRVKNIYVNSELTEKINQYTNEGKTYC